MQRVNQRVRRTTSAENGVSDNKHTVRQFEPTTDYRDLLSPETRKALEERFGSGPQPASPWGDK